MQRYGRIALDGEIQSVGNQSIQVKQLHNSPGAITCTDPQALLKAKQLIGKSACLSGMGNYESTDFKLSTIKVDRVLPFIATDLALEIESIRQNNYCLHGHTIGF